MSKTRYSSKNNVDSHKRVEHKVNLGTQFQTGQKHTLGGVSVEQNLEKCEDIFNDNDGTYGIYHTLFFSISIPRCFLSSPIYPILDCAAGKLFLLHSIQLKNKWVDLLTEYQQCEYTEYQDLKMSK